MQGNFEIENKKCQKEKPESLEWNRPMDERGGVGHGIVKKLPGSPIGRLTGNSGG